LPNIRKFKSQRIILVWHVEGIGRVRNVCIFLVGEFEGKRPLGRTNKMDLYRNRV
jgi:hypothetical protein